MKIHTDHLVAYDLVDAVRYATDVTGHGHVGHAQFPPESRSRSRDRGFTVYLRGDGSVYRRWTNSGTHGGGGDYAASYDSWGNFLAYLFAIDPDMIAGPYDGVEDFHRQVKEAAVHRKDSAGAYVIPDAATIARYRSILART